MKFQVFKNGQLIQSFKLCGAYLFGADGIGVRRAEITFKNGLIHCKKPNTETAGLTLLWPIEDFGSVLLPTTCLPERERPYNLNVEIARAKLMQVVNKREDWSFFDGIEGLAKISKKAQELFVSAIQNISNPPLASRLADESLRMAMALSERLAVLQADSAFALRGRSHGFGRGCLGCQVDPLRIEEPGYVERLVELFGSATVPISWAAVEPQRGQYDFATLDKCIQTLGRRRVAIGVGPLLCFSKSYLPKWLMRGRIGFEKIRDTAYQFASAAVARYAPAVRTWIAISGLNVFNHFGFKFEQILEMTRAATMAVKASSERAVKVIDVANPWGEYYITTPNSIPPVVYMDMVVQSGINFDAFGLKVQFGRNQTGMHMRDMMHVSAMLDDFGPIAKPLHMTGVQVPSQNGDGPQDGRVAGIWHAEWDDSQQGQWIEQFCKVALSKPFVDRVTYGRLADGPRSTIAHSGLLTEKLQPKQSYLTLKKLHDSIFIR